MEHPGQTTRPPAYAELLIDSLDRFASGAPPGVNAVTTSSDWRTNLEQYVLYGYFTRLAVTQIQFFWNLPTIITGYNDSARFIYQNAPNPPVAAQLTIPQGYYTPTTLAAAIQAALIAVNPAPGFTCTYEADLGAFVIDCGAGWTFGWAVGNAGIAQLPEVRLLNTIGMQYFRGQGGVNTLAGSPPLMLATRYIDICSATLTKFQRVKDSTTLQNPTISNIIARVYPTAPNTRATVSDMVPTGSAPFVICIDYNTPKQIKWSPEEALANFDLQLRDEYGALIPFNPGGVPGPCCEYQLTLLASES
jgi:hypothetical protein